MTLVKNQILFSKLRIENFIFKMYDSLPLSVPSPVILYSRVIFAVGGEGVVCLVTQRGAVSLHLVKRLRNVNHCIFIQ